MDVSISLVVVVSYGRRDKASALVFAFPGLYTALKLYPCRNKAKSPYDNGGEPGQLALFKLLTIPM